MLLWFRNEWFRKHDDNDAKIKRKKITKKQSHRTDFFKNVLAKLCIPKIKITCSNFAHEIVKSLIMLKSVSHKVESLVLLKSPG